MNTCDTGGKRGFERLLEGTRKYTVWWVVFFTISGFLIGGQLNEDNYTDLLKGVFALYMAGNVGEHFANRGEKK